MRKCAASGGGVSKSVAGRHVGVLRLVLVSVLLVLVLLDLHAVTKHGLASGRSLRKTNGLVLHHTDFDSTGLSAGPYQFALTELRQYKCSVALNVSSACPLCALSVVLNHTETGCAFFGHAKTLRDGRGAVHVAGKVPAGDYVLSVYVETVNNADVLGRTVAANGCTELSVDGQVLDHNLIRNHADGRPVLVQAMALEASGPCQDAPRTWTCDGAMHSWGRFEDVYTLVGKASPLRGVRVQEKCLHVHFIGDSLTRNLYYEFLSYETQHEPAHMDFARWETFGCSVYRYHQAFGFHPAYQTEDKARPSNCTIYTDAELVKREKSRAAHLGYETLEALLQNLKRTPRAVLVIGLGMWHKVAYVKEEHNELFRRNVELLNATFRGPVIHLLTPSLHIGEDHPYDSNYRRMAEAERAKALLSSYPNQRYLDAFTLSAGRRDRFYDRVHYFSDPNPTHPRTLADFPPTIAAALNEDLRDILLDLDI